MITWLQGKKTYILAGLSALYAIAGYLTGHLDGPTALGILYTSGILGSLRSAIAKVGQ